MNRISELDFFRGLAILWVLFIHCIFWMGFLTSDNVMILKSYLLFEMPLLFLITGAANSLSKKPIKLGTFYFRRLTRILIPYWFFAAICVFIIQISITFLNFTDNVSYLSWFITLGIIPQTSSIPYLTWHLWYIPVVVIIIFFSPLLIKLHRTLKNKWKLIPLFLILCFIFLLDIFNFGESYYYIKNTIFYSFWIYLGLFYCEYKDRKFNKKILITISILSYIAVYFFIEKGYSSNMQINKFPPNFVFLILNIGTISLILTFKDAILRIFKSLKLESSINELGKQSYTIYLYHPFAFLLGGILLDLFNVSSVEYDIIGILFFFILNLLCAKLFINLFGKIEGYKFNIKFK